MFCRQPVLHLLVSVVFIGMSVVVAPSQVLRLPIHSFKSPPQNLHRKRMPLLWLMSMECCMKWLVLKPYMLPEGAAARGTEV